MKTYCRSKLFFSFVVAFSISALLWSNSAAAQQIVGSFPNMDGGYEGQTVGAISTVANSSSPSASNWTRSAATGTSTIRNIVAVGSRTGNNFLSINSSGTGTVVALSPSVNSGAIIGNNPYTIQFYYRATDVTTLPNTQITVGASNASGTQITATNYAPNAATNNANWLKSTTTVTAANAATPTTGFSALRIAGSASTNAKGIDIDDWVMYAGTTDIDPPSNPGAAATANPSGSTIDLSWGAAADVDGGGYIVVRYTSNPVTEPNPNLNGMYKVGNAIGNGTVVYIAQSLGFIDNGLSNNTTYYYRIYTVDKAFNYSSAVVASGITSTLPATIKYYIDANAGNDLNTGTIGAPWQNISKLNTQTLIAGAQVYLKCGSVWTGQRLKFLGSGTNARPIVIDKYGTGATPLLAGNGLTGDAVVYLYNQQHIEINNLEITNSPNGPVNGDFFVGLFQNGTNPLGADRRGVMVAIDNFGTANHIYLNNLNIHHIKGQLGNGNTAVNGAIPKRTGGIYFTVLGAIEQTATKSRFNDVLIDSCTIAYSENTGLAFDNEWNVYYPGGQFSAVAADVTEYNNWFDRRYSNVKVSNNVIHHIGKNAMIIRCTDETGLIERNVCYETALGTTGNTIFTARAKGTILQYNEGYFNRATTQTVDPGNIDGSLYDPDFGSVGIIFQYSYSHDNSQGLYWGCNTRGANNNTTGIPDPGDVGCTARYNISQNDLGDLVYFNYSSAGNEIYNNVFYTKAGLSPNIIHENSGNAHTYNFRNNIIYNLSNATSGASYAFGTGPSTQNRTVQNNLFYGSHPASEPSDINKIITNPIFVNPGSGGIGLGSVLGYKLQTGSPAIASGYVITNNGWYDYFGNIVPTASAPNRGFFEGAGVVMPVSLFNFRVTQQLNNADVLWSTYTEQNSSHFEIERSKNANNFKKIGSVTAAGNSVSEKSYLFKDNEPEIGKNYYRLRSVDLDGKSEYSEVRSANFSGKFSITVSPNPAGVNATLKSFSPAKIPVTILVADASGCVVLSIQGNLDSPIQIPLSTLAKGIYFLKVVNRSNYQVLHWQPLFKI
jgi:hypothetical protein